MPRTAALLCIQNSAESLGWWIAHHVAVGFSTLLICDDHSTDGSRELLVQAAQHYDVRISNTDAAIEDTYERRQSALRELAKQEASDLDWVLPLSVDEYAFPEASSIAHMFHHMAEHMGDEAFQKATTLPLNWCVVGLNDIPPLEMLDQPSPRALYTRHAPHDFPDHRVTRSFFRPSTLTDALPDPLSRLHVPADWSFGRILHDAALSSLSEAGRHYYNRNDVAYYDGGRFLKESQHIAATLLNTLLLTHTRHLRQSNDPLPASGTSAPPLERHYIGSLERFLVIEHQTHRVVWRKRSLYNKENETRLCLASLPSQSSEEKSRKAWLYTEDALSLPYLPLNGEAQRLSHFLDILPLTLTQHSDGAELSLGQHAEKIALDGESLFPLFPAPQQRSSHKGPFDALTALTRYGLSASGVRSALHDMSWNAPSALAAISAHLPSEEASQVLSPFLLRLFHGSPT